MQLVTLFKHVEVLVDTPGGAYLTFYTDLPGDALTARGTAVIPPTVGRHPYRLELSGAAKGKLYKVQIVPLGSAIVRVYAAKVYARVLGPAPTAWQWYTVPVLETPVDWQPIKLPIPQTSDDWMAKALPIEPTPEEYAEMKLPIKPTPVVPDWVQVQVDS